MLERLTFLLGISVSVIGWLFGYVTTDLTSTPALYHFVSIRTVGSGTDLKLYSVVSVENLSRHGVVPPVTMTITANGSKGGCIKGIPVPAGVLWTKDDSAPIFDKDDPRHASVTFRTLMPGSMFQVDTPVDDDCDVRVNFSFDNSAPNQSVVPVRMLNGGIEVFLIKNYLMIFMCLLLSFGVIFLISFVCALMLSSANARLAENRRNESVAEKS
jgi:hypothetical protein